MKRVKTGWLTSLFCFHFQLKLLIQFQALHSLFENLYNPYLIDHSFNNKKTYQIIQLQIFRWCT